MGSFSDWATCLIVFFSVLFWVTGAVSIGIGVMTEEYIKIMAYILISFGAFFFLIGFSGCCGAIKSNKHLLGLYIFFLVIVIAGEVVVGISVEAKMSDDWIFRLKGALWMGEHSSGLYGVGCGIVALEIISLAFAIYLCRRKGREVQQQLEGACVDNPDQVTPYFNTIG